MITTPYTDKFHADTLANNGATVDLRQRTLPAAEDAYFVGGGSWCHTISVERFTPDYIARLVHIARVEGYWYLGTWVDRRTVYIKPTTVVDSITDAYNIARDRGEKSFYDNVNKRVIRGTFL